MVVEENYLEHVKDLLSSIEGVTYRVMFGGYGVFHEGDMFALISGADPMLYFKVGDLNRDAFKAAGGQRFGLMSYYQVPADVLEDSEKMRDWASEAIGVGHLTSKNHRR
ncbi:MAG: hypothetical protein BZY79_01760 [SAR202 cluster bacterium Casp-Chloro-G4]|nr:TfoX/Sxy family protein [Chloroflexota bacterium]MDA1227084.1 TfoX/Sxy family protein [Chloroflexota bacterium]PKB61840.1 MAG: hypothetical protein BZY79_01760 [SAR202 cluster bacterium Casp-Chloro-G4]